MRRSESDTRTHSCHKNTLALDEYRWFISSGKGARVSLWHCSLCVWRGRGGGAPGQGQGARAGGAWSVARPARARARPRPPLSRPYSSPAMSTFSSPSFSQHRPSSRAPESRSRDSRGWHADSAHYWPAGRARWRRSSLSGPRHGVLGRAVAEPPVARREPAAETTC